MRRWPALAGAAALCAALAASGAAAPVPEPRGTAALASRQSAAVLELYALESRLARANARLAAFQARRAAVEDQLARLRIELDVAWQSLYAAQRLLGSRIRQLYEHGQIDPVAILLGAESLDEAVDGIEGLRNLAAGDRALLEQVTRARDQLRRAKARVRKRAAALTAAERSAAATAAQLRRAAVERRAYIASLRAERGYTRRRIARLDTTAVAAQKKSAAIAASTANDVPDTGEASPLPDVALVANGAQITVVATGYAIRGQTATGLATAWGVVAVDPSVIPLGTRLTIPGYGTGVAADTGGGVNGNEIDLWFPTTAQALAWGRRTVTITLHG